MTLEEACRLLDPNTTAEELAKIEYYNGFNGKKACIEAINEACTLLVGAVRSAHHTKHGAAPPRTAQRSTLYPSTKSKRFSMTSGAANGKQRRRPESASCACRTPWTTARRWWPWTIPPATPGRRILQAFRRRWNGSTGRMKNKWTGFVDF